MNIVTYHLNFQLLKQSDLQSAVLADVERVTTTGRATPPAIISAQILMEPSDVSSGTEKDGTPGGTRPMVTSEKHVFSKL